MLIAERPAMVSRLKGSLTFLAARMNFCLGVSGRGVAELRKRANIGISGWQLMTLSAGLEESGLAFGARAGNVGAAAFRHRHSSRKRAG
jgi:hypothetical protein